MTVSYQPTLMQSQASLPKKVAVSTGIMAVLILFVYFFQVPNPNMILIAGLVFCSALFGFGGGIVAAAIMVGYTLFFFSTDHSFLHYTTENLQKVCVSLLGVLADMLFVCLLKHMEVKAFQKVALLTEELNRENERLQSMSMTDALTGIRNRMALRMDYDSYQNCEATVMMLDLNQFKMINDTLGHSEGDRVLRETGHLLADTFGAERCYRYGGDEFLVILPDLSEAEFREKLETMMESRPTLTMDGETSRVGYSVGYVHAPLKDHDTLRNLMSTADERMYQVKRDGGYARKDESRPEKAQASEPVIRDAEYTVEALRGLLGRLSGSYDLVRVVDPIECRVLELQENGSITRDERCYGVWHSEQKCLNCSSAAACRTRLNQEKKEQFEDKTFDIESHPVSLRLPDGGVCDAVVELIKTEKENPSSPANDRAAEDIGTRADHYQALHDSLTSALNATAFYELSREMIGNNPRRCWVMITGNIMHFRLVNNLFGVQKGNEVLMAAAARLRGIASQAHGLCGRLGGDQFAVLIPADAYQEEQLRSTARALAQDFQSGIYTLCIHFGVYRIQDASIPVSIMCGRANSALYTIRENLTEVVAYFDDTLMQKTLMEQMIISGYEEALESGQFRMYLQPLVEENGHIVGAEALARWCRPDGSILLPGVFIEVLEQAGLIHKLDRYIWELAVRQLSLWKGTEKETLSISVNISAKDFYSIDVYDTLVSLLEAYDVESSRLRLEITETALLVDPEKSDAIVSMLRDRGFLVEIDDFGKGYSSLGLLKNIHADVLKIDMSFLREIRDHQRSRAILESVINMATSLGMQVVTEGVETQEQLCTLSAMGCRHFQGFFFSRPVPVEEFEAKLVTEPGELTPQNC